MPPVPPRHWALLPFLVCDAIDCGPGDQFFVDCVEDPAYALAMAKKQSPQPAPDENSSPGKIPAKKPVVIKGPSKTVFRAKK